MSENTFFDIKELRKKEAQKFAQQKEAIEKEKRDKEEKDRQEKEKIRLENETKMLKELQEANEFEELLGTMESLIIETQNAKNITEIDICVMSCMSMLENSGKFIDNEGLRQDIRGKVMEMINAISQNTNSKFNITKQNEKETSQRIINNTKTMLNLIKMDDDDIDIELMDTKDDGELAKKLEEENKRIHSMDNMEDMSSYFAKRFGGIGHRLGRKEKKRVHFCIPKIEETNEDDTVDFSDIKIENPLPTPPSTDVYHGFESIDDPELLQLMHYQNEELDQN